MQRLVLGLSQEKLGDALGLSFQQVQKYEKGSNRISASRMQQIANFLQVTPEFIFDGLSSQSADNAPTSSYVNEFIASRDGVALAKAFMRLKSATLKRAIVHLVEELAER
jgi:transcriptional regulator with XRE-family HTH domain